MNPHPFTRRQFLQAGLVAGLAGLTHSTMDPLQAAPPAARSLKIGACDWSIGKMSQPSGLELAARIGLDGLQVSLGDLANDMHLRRPEVQKQFMEASRQTGVAIASLALGELNNIPYKSDPRTVAWVHDSVDVCRALGCKVILLAFFHHNDLRGDKAGTDETVRRLKEVAPHAEKNGVVLGLETWLSADEHLDIIERVGSKAVRVYYDVANSQHMGYDIYEEIRRLGTRYICELHMKENGFLLGQGKVDFPRVRAILDEIGYSGWMQIEGAVPSGQGMFESYVENRKYLQKVFELGG